MIIQIIDDFSTLRLVDQTAQGTFNISVEKTSGIVLEVRGDVLRFTYPTSENPLHQRTIEIIYSFVTDPVSTSAEDLRTKIEAILDNIPGVQIYLEADNFTDLTTTHPPAANAGKIAIVENSQGVAWLPGSILGTFYSKGWYKSDGLAWVDFNDEIAAELQNILDTKQNFITTPTNGNAAGMDATGQTINSNKKTANILSDGQKAAVNNTAGTPSSLNPFILDDDARLTQGAPLAHAASHEDGASDEINGENLATSTTRTNYTPTATNTGGEFTGIDNKLADKLETVSSDTTLTGDGTSGSPLSVVPVVTTQEHAECYFAGVNTTDTVIATQSTPVKIAGTTSFGLASTDWSMPASNRLQWNGAATIRVRVLATCSHEKGGGSNDEEIRYYVAKSGVVIAKSKSISRIIKNAFNTTAPKCISDISTGEYFEVFAENTTDNKDFRVTDFHLEAIQIL